MDFHKKKGLISHARSAPDVLLLFHVCQQPLIYFCLPCLICTYLSTGICGKCSVHIDQINRLCSFSKDSRNSSVSTLMTDVDKHPYSLWIRYTKFPYFCFIFVDLLIHQLVLTFDSSICLKQFYNNSCSPGAFGNSIFCPVFITYSCPYIMISCIDLIPLILSHRCMNQFQKTLCFCTIPLTCTNCDRVLCTAVCKSLCEITIFLISINLSTA